MAAIKFSLIVPIYKSEASLPNLLDALAALHQRLDGQLEVVFVVDASPDRSFALLSNALPGLSYAAQLLVHSRNFGVFSAIRSGLAVAKGQYYGAMAADMQEPPELLEQMFRLLEADDCDVTIGVRVERDDPVLSRLSAELFWWLYRRLVLPEMPKGGVGTFACNRVFKEHLLALQESRSSMVAQLFWLGFRRKAVAYSRQKRQEGKSAWTFRRKVDYMLDSIFAFTDFPIRLLMRIGLLGCLLSIVLGGAVFVAQITGHIQVSGYAAIILTILFFGMVNVLALGVVGNYAWRTYENTKLRPLEVVAIKLDNQGHNESDVGHG